MNKHRALFSDFVVYLFDICPYHTKKLILYPSKTSKKNLSGFLTFSRDTDIERCRKKRLILYFAAYFQWIMNHFTRCAVLRFFQFHKHRTLSANLWIFPCDNAITLFARTCPQTMPWNNQNTILTDIKLEAPN